MKHQPRKRFGQNFLQDEVVISHILQAFQPQLDDEVIEIGPGQGALTKLLMKQLHHLTAIEIDRDLQLYLQTLSQAAEKLRLIHADALTINYSQFGSSLRIIGNLPYNISTPLIIHLLKQCHCIKDMLFMLQKEVVDRLVAVPGSKHYGRLSVMVQYFCQAYKLFEIGPEAFFPPPKVDSAMVYLQPYTVSPYPILPFSVLEQVVAQAFLMRRKTIANNLRPLVNAQQIELLGIRPQSRPEELSVADYTQLAKIISK